MSDPLPFDDLETVYELLAAAIDEVDEENESLFLAKLVMLLAHEMGDLETFQDALNRALAKPDKGRDGC